MDHLQIEGYLSKSFTGSFKVEKHRKQKLASGQCFLNFSHDKNHLGFLLGFANPLPFPEDSDSVGLEWDPAICSFNKCSGDICTIPKQHRYTLRKCLKDVVFKSGFSITDLGELKKKTHPGAWLTSIKSVFQGIEHSHNL